LSDASAEPTSDSDNAASAALPKALESRCIEVLPRTRRLCARRSSWRIEQAHVTLIEYRMQYP
jgi:hypothetical protein